MEGLPHDFYMSNYIKDISEWRKNISKGEYNKSTIEYLPKLEYFNKYGFGHFPLWTQLASLGTIFTVSIYLLPSLLFV